MHDDGVMFNRINNNNQIFIEFVEYITIRSLHINLSKPACIHICAF